MDKRLKELGIQAGGIWIEHATAFLSGTLNLERFAELVLQNYISQIMTTEEREQFIRDDEREACAALCTEMGNKQTNQCFYDPWDCASSIRARGKK